MATLTVNTGVIVAPTAGERVMYQYQINGISAVHFSGFAPRMWLGALWFESGPGNPNARLAFGIVYQAANLGLPPGGAGFDYPALASAGNGYTTYPDVAASVQVAASGEISLTMFNGADDDGWCNLVLTLSPEMILPPGFVPNLPVA